MALALSGSVALRIFMTLQDALDMSTPEDVLEKQIQKVLSSGAGTLQVDRIFHDTRSINASTNDDLDMVGGALLTPFGTAFSLARLKFIAIKAADNNGTQVLTIGNATNAAALFQSSGSNTATLRAGDFMSWSRLDATGWALTGGSTDVLRINNGSGAIATYDIVLLGSST